LSTSIQAGRRFLTGDSQPGHGKAVALTHWPCWRETSGCGESPPPAVCPFALQFLIAAPSQSDLVRANPSAVPASHSPAGAGAGMPGPQVFPNSGAPPATVPAVPHSTRSSRSYPPADAGRKPRLFAKQPHFLRGHSVKPSQTKSDLVWENPPKPQPTFPMPTTFPQRRYGAFDPPDSTYNSPPKHQIMKRIIARLGTGSERKAPRAAPGPALASGALCLERPHGHQGRPRWACAHRPTAHPPGASSGCQGGFVPPSHWPPLRSGHTSRPKGDTRAPLRKPLKMNLSCFANHRTFLP
jgi:hypothetical protein